MMNLDNDSFTHQLSCYKIIDSARLLLPLLMVTPVARGPNCIRKGTHESINVRGFSITHNLLQ